MNKKNSITLKESELKELITETVKSVLEQVGENSILRVEDFFDLSSLSKNALRSITIDYSALIGGLGYGSDLLDNGELIIKEGTNITMPIKELRKELQIFGFKSWQIKTYVYANKVRIVVLLVDLGENLQLVENKMLACGWTKSRISDPKIMHGVTVRAMEFDLKVQKSLSKEARRYHYLYHWTPYRNIGSILTKGLEVRNENDYLSYPPKIHLMKGDITKYYAATLGWQPFNRNKSLKSGKYALLRIRMDAVPQNVDFYGDPRYPLGYFTNESIPPEAIELYGQILYYDKYNYGYEQIKVLVQDDTMMD